MPPIALTSNMPVSLTVFSNISPALSTGVLSPFRPVWAFKSPPKTTCPSPLYFRKQVSSSALAFLCPVTSCESGK